MCVLPYPHAQVLRQGLDILRMLRDAGVVHNDLLVRNMLLRNPHSPAFQLAFIDFCNAQLLSELHAAAPRNWGCQPKDVDVFSFICSVTDSLYSDRKNLGTSLPVIVLARAFVSLRLATLHCTGFCR